MITVLYKGGILQFSEEITDLEVERFTLLPFIYKTMP